MAKRRRKSNPRRRVAARRRNTAVRVVTRHRRRSMISRGRRHNRRRNPMPSFFGSSGARGLGTSLAGGLLGVAAAKLIPGFVPGNILGTSPWAKVAITGASAWAAGTLAKKFGGAVFGDAVLFGGAMQTGSMLLNILLPNFRVGGVPLALSGMGELMPGSFPVPQNPLRMAGPVPVQARIGTSGLDRAFGRAI